MGAALSTNARVVIVGAGITGAACARELQRRGVECVVLERGRAVGGRLASPTIEGRRVDLGAAYFTVTDESFAAEVKSWRAAGLAKTWTDTLTVLAPPDPPATAAGPMRWRAPGGMRSLVRHLLLGLDVRLESPVSAIGSSAGSIVVELPGGAGGRSEQLVAEHVVLAMPDPQATRLLPETGPLAGLSAVLDVQFEPVLAVAAGWPERMWPFLTAAFVNGDPDLTLLADDGSRRGDGAAVLVAHTTADLARRHLSDPAGARGPILAALQRVAGIDVTPSWLRIHRWGLAKPLSARPASFHLDQSGVGLAGDSWCPGGAPRVESAWLSGTALGRAIAAQLA